MLRRYLALTLTDRLAWLAWIAAFVFLLVAPTAYWNGGVLEDETAVFILQYLDGRPFIQKVFDPGRSDWGLFQARELSYAVDYLDAHAFRFLLRTLDLVLLVPLSAFISSLLLGVAYYLGVRRCFPSIDRLTAALLLLVLLTSFVFVSTMGVFYRATKPFVGPVLLILIFYLIFVDERRQLEPGSHRVPFEAPRMITVFGLTTVMGLLDRQGFFYGVGVCAILAIHVVRTRRLGDLLIAGGAAVVFVQGYNTYFGPWLIHEVNGYWPNPYYQDVSYRSLLTEPVLALRAIHLLSTNAVALLGGPHLWRFLGVGLIVVGVSALLKGWKPAGLLAQIGQFCHRYRATVLYWLAALALQVIMFALMIWRHPPVYSWIDHWFWYYPYPFLVTLLVGLTMVVHAVLPRMSVRGRQVLRLGILLVAICNLLALNQYREVTMSWRWFSVVHAQSEVLRSALRSGVFDSRLAPNYARLFEYCRQLKSRSADMTAPDS